MAQRTAMRFSVNGALEYVELAPGYAIMELDVPDHWAGHTILGAPSSLSREVVSMEDWKFSLMHTKQKSKEAGSSERSTSGPSAPSTPRLFLPPTPTSWWRAARTISPGW